MFLFLITFFIVLLLMAYKKRDKLHLFERKKLEEEFNNQLLQSQIEVQEQTFQQIGKELHDNVGQLLSTSRMLIGLTQRSLQSPPDMLHTANETLGKAINEIRNLSKSLDKEWLEQFNLIQNLKTEIERINAANTLKANLVVNKEPILPSAKQIILFRIIQEAMQNAIKYSNCNNLNIQFIEQNTNLKIIIVDDGAGFEMDEITAGMGLKNMQYRTSLLGGTISVESKKNKGTTVKILLKDIEHED